MSCKGQVTAVPADSPDRRSARERDARRAALFVLVATSISQLANATDGRGLLWLGLVFVAIGFYYAIKSTFRLESEDEPEYER